jgi:hypothetical protein
MRRHDPKVIRLLPGGQAVISTRGLCCVVVKPNGDVVRQLLPRHRAEAVASTLNAIDPARGARVLTYAQLAAMRRRAAAT